MYPTISPAAAKTAAIMRRDDAIAQAQSRRLAAQMRGGHRRWTTWLHH